jgi:hypothetical protein
MDSMRQRLIYLVTILVAGCGTSKTDRPVVTTTSQGMESSPAGTEAAARDRSLVRFVDALQRPGDVDLTADGRTVFPGVAYKAVTNYQEIGQNVAKFRLRIAGSDSVLADNNEGLRDGSRYTVVSMPGVNGQPRLRIVKDELVTDPSKARLRVIQAVPRIGEVDVAVVGRREPIFKGVTYASEAGYQDLAPMTATIEIRQDKVRMPPIRIKDMHLVGGHAYTIVLTGDKSGAIEAITFDDQIEPAGAAPLSPPSQ